MKFLLIPLAIVCLGLIPLAVLLWVGARERRQTASLNDPELGELKLFKSHWETATPIRLSNTLIELWGEGDNAGPTEKQKATLQFVKDNAPALFSLAVNAAKIEISSPIQNRPIDDLAVSDLTLGETADTFELLVKSPTLLPDGVTVSFSGLKVENVEVIH